MNDFLSALLERSAGQAPVLLPRQLSRFEPADRTMAELADHFEATTEDREPVRRREGRRAVEEPAPVYPVKRDDERASAPPPVRPEGPPRAHVEEIRKVASPARSDEASRGVDAVPISRRESAPSSPARPQLVLRQETTHRTVVERTVERQMPARPKAPADSVVDARSSRPTEALRPAMPSLVSPMPRARSERSAEPPPAPTPTIQVSIGRIEIRSQQAAPPAAARPPRPSGPKLNLEQYLAGRNGGGR